MLGPTQAEAAHAMTLPPVEYGYGRPDPGYAAPRQFKRHKVLPRPQPERVQDSPRRRPKKYDLVVDTSQPASSGSLPSSPRTLKHQPKRIGTGPDLPPTPPTQSRTSSGSHSGRQPSPPTTDNASQTTPKTAVQRAPVTPPDQRSPPTPDVTPPQPAHRPRALQLPLGDRVTSRPTPGDSRTESFKTAREEPFSSEDEDGKSTIRPAVASASTSQTSVRPVPETTNVHSNRIPQPQALGQALARLGASSEDPYTPRTRGEFGKFDGDWGSTSDVEQEWDDNLQRSVTVKKRRPGPETPRVNGHKTDIVEDNLVTPTNATKTVRNMALREKNVPTASPKGTPEKRNGSSTNPSTSGTSVSTSVRRNSGLSGRSFASTVVEAVLVDGPSPPQRRRTLRHVTKQRGLRESLHIPSDSTVDSSGLDRQTRQIRPNPRREDGRQESYTSHATVNSIASGRARRDVWKNGGIPVVVVPDRRSSSKSRSSREPSLRSTSSRRSKTMSLGSAPMDAPTNKEHAPISGQNVRRGRAYSESDGSDTRTIDYPPTIPARSSSLSAPTSRNTSRAGSMTAESINARNKMQLQSAAEIQPAPQLHTEVERQQIPESQPDPVPRPRNPEIIAPPEPELLVSPALPVSPAFPSPSSRDEGHDRFSGLSVDHHDDAHSSRRYTARNTPFSAASIDTNGTAPELSEATAIHMYAHQNSSVLMVNHSAKPSDASDATERQRELPELGQPKIMTTAPGDEIPVTPPQPRFSLDDVDSPLRNPRAPPEPPAFPPAINFIPATPSGHTPATDKMAHMGNYFEATEEKPARRPSIIRQALGRRRHSVQYPPTASRAAGFLTRTLSLSRNVGRPSREAPRAIAKPDMEGHTAYPQAEDPPAEENKLHPFWRPHRFDDDDDECDSDCDCRREDAVYKYPPVDNRPAMPRRSLSARMKQTFAILPTRDSYIAARDSDGTEHRTIQRTPSGNLRVMRRRASAESMGRDRDFQGRPYTAPDDAAGRGFWRGNSVHRRVSKERQRRFSIGSKLEEIQSIPRRLSEKRREKRTQELRQKISGPREVRDGVGEVIRSGSGRRQPYGNHPYGANGQI